jgi:hypothetical protein
MTRRITAAVALLLALTVAAPAAAHAGQGAGDLIAAPTALLPVNYCDTQANWVEWQMPATGAKWGAGRWCGHVRTGEYRLGSWDRDYGGDCVTIWGSATMDGGYGAMPGTTACGYGVVVTTPWRFNQVAKMLLVKHTPGGSWIASFQFYNCARDEPPYVSC